MDLFKENIPEDKNVPLALRMSPETIEEISGQEHILARGKLLRRAIDSDTISSAIFYGPPGVGKTALALVISRKTGADFIRKNAVSNNVADIRKVVEQAEKLKALSGKKTILLLDEIHRFSKTQQDVLLPEVEMGKVVLIGTTTENPFFSINSALLSRSQVFEFKRLGEDEIREILKRAINDRRGGLGDKTIRTDEGSLEHIALMADGDARKALGALEIAVKTTAPADDGTIHITLDVAEDSIQRKCIVYDRKGDGHYDAASAYIKSMRGSDPDAALYWLAKMIEAGEDPAFIARRLVICASEDVGNADPQALILANSAMQAAMFIGMPEARIILAQATIYVACAIKSNASYLAIDTALEDIRKERTQDIPVHLRSFGYRGAEILGRGEGYKYAHDHEGHYVEQDYMNEKKSYYNPREAGKEKEFCERLRELRNERKSKSDKN